jgi:hypothetical protein
MQYLFIGFVSSGAESSHLSKLELFRKEKRTGSHSRSLFLRANLQTTAL